MSRRLTVFVWAASAAVALSVGHVRIGAKDEAPNEWRYYSGDNGAKKYSPLDQINKDTVSRLRIAWRRPHVDPAVVALLPPNYRLPNNFRSTPIMVDGVLYAPNGVGLAEAFDPETGKTIWIQKPGAGEFQVGTSNRGAAYWRQAAAWLRSVREPSECPARSQASAPARPRR